MARIPLDPPRTWFFRLAEWYSRRTYGAVLDPGAAMAHNPRVLLSTVRHEQSIARWNRPLWAPGVTAALPPFDRHRRLLFSVAYQMLGSVSDAEDVVQDAWLRWSAVDRSQVTDERAYLVQIASRLALDRLSSARSRRVVSDGAVEQVLIVRNPDKLTGLVRPDGTPARAREPASGGG